MGQSKPGVEWYREMNKVRVKRDLEGTELINLLGCQLNAFIKFAAKQRFTYEENIYEEYKEFKNRDKRLYEIDIDLWSQIRNKVFERDSYTCQYCGQVGGELEVDHIFPFSRGGKETMDNLVTSCMKCNRNKKDKTPEEAGLKIINDPRGEVKNGQ